MHIFSIPLQIDHILGSCAMYKANVSLLIYVNFALAALVAWPCVQTL